MKVWIDQDQCTGSGLCEAIEPSVFLLDAEGLATVRDGDTEDAVTVPPQYERQVEEAAQACPGACIRIESD
jgi:ferredoxin